jgi:hypothetical protein
MGLAGALAEAVGSESGGMDEARYVSAEGGVLSRGDLAWIKKCAKVMNLSWQSIAARPSKSKALLDAKKKGASPEEAAKAYAKAEGTEGHDLDALDEAKAVSANAIRDRLLAMKKGDTFQTKTRPNFKVTCVGSSAGAPVVKWVAGRIKGQGIALDLVDAMEEAGIKIESADETDLDQVFTEAVQELTERTGAGYVSATVHQAAKSLDRPLGGLYYRIRGEGSYKQGGPYLDDRDKSKAVALEKRLKKLQGELKDLGRDISKLPLGFTV